jgi:predicted PP-loop superfamily ATPase
LNSFSLREKARMRGFEKAVIKSPLPNPLPRGEGDNRVGTDMSQVKKVVLAYSGGLDTSVILKWLEEV